MVMFTRANGSMIRQKEKALTPMLMALIMKENGLTTNSTDRVLNLGRMAPDMKALTKMERKKDKEG